MALLLAGVLFILSWLGKIGIARLDQRILIAVAALSGHRYVGWLIGAVLFDCAFAGIFVAGFVV